MLKGQGSGVRARGSRVQGPWSWVRSLGLGFMGYGMWFGVQGLDTGVHRGSGFRYIDLGFRVKRLGFEVLGAKFRVQRLLG